MLFYDVGRSQLIIREGHHVTHPCRKYCQEAIELSQKLLTVADAGHSSCDHDACLVLFGIILDSASVIQREANKRLKLLEAETAAHV